MAIDAFLKIDGIPGESLDAQFSNWIEMEDFDVGASQSASATTTSSTESRAVGWGGLDNRFKISLRALTEASGLVFIVMTE
jgi:type VI protein secretion system component Hcp